MNGGGGECPDGVIGISTDRGGGGIHWECVSTGGGERGGALMWRNRWWLWKSAADFGGEWGHPNMEKEISGWWSSNCIFAKQVV